jgi:hypothetical protein
MDPPGHAAAHSPFQSTRIFPAARETYKAALLPQLYYQNTMAGEGQDTISIGNYLLERLSQIGVQAGPHCPC